MCIIWKCDVKNIIIILICCCKSAYIAILNMDNDMDSWQGPQVPLSGPCQDSILFACGWLWWSSCNWNHPQANVSDTQALINSGPRNTSSASVAVKYVVSISDANVIDLWPFVVCYPGLLNWFSYMMMTALHYTIYIHIHTASSCATPITCYSIKCPSIPLHFYSHIGVYRCDSPKCRIVCPFSLSSSLTKKTACTSCE